MLVLKYVNADAMLRLLAVQEHNIIAVVVTVWPVQQAGHVATDLYGDCAAKLAKVPLMMGDDTHCRQACQQELNPDSGAPVNKQGEVREAMSEGGQSSRSNLLGVSDVQQPYDKSEGTTADWPVNEDWECSWPATEDWFVEGSLAKERAKAARCY
jgi:hypothetical protein